GLTLYSRVNATAPEPVDVGTGVRSSRLLPKADWPSLSETMPSEFVSAAPVGHEAPLPTSSGCSLFASRPVNETSTVSALQRQRRRAAHARAVQRGERDAEVNTTTTTTTSAPTDREVVVH